ncbi:MAG TPA: uracil-DNA glycosylase [Candidatus Atribacteria bacterium]|nr:uracil-DNA glycosylase [Candidatus Atribacteria bacterium]
MSEYIQPITLEEVAKECRSCKKCPLYLTRTKVVPGEGKAKLKVMLIGEAPGEEEDLKGRPFVGKAGQLLTKILQSVDIKREEVFITNMVKCRPPGNRNPSKSEIETCFPYLETQIAIINPKIIVTLGNVPTQYLLDTTTEGISKLRGRWFDWLGEIKIFPMFHPSYLLRNEGTFPGSPKELTWKDIKTLKRTIVNL